MQTDKLPVIFVPGLGATGEVYQPFLDRLRTHYAVRVAMHPLSMPERLDWNFFFDTIERAAEGRDRFILVGHSMGGQIALAYASDHPGRVARVVAVAPPLFPKRHTASGQGLSRFRWYRRLQNFALGVLSANPLHALRSVKIRGQVLAHGRRRKLYDWVNQADVSDRLPKLRQAVVLAPKREEVIKPYHIERLRAEFPNVTVRDIAGSHNYLPLNPRPIFNDILEAIDG